MSDAFVGEIRMFGFNWAPKGWAACQGQILPVQQNAALFSLLGVQFGGDGQRTFGLPDFQGRMPVHVNQGSGLLQGQKGGSESVTLTSAQMPQHTHILSGDNEAGVVVLKPQSVFANSGEPSYNSSGTLVPLNAGTCSPAGGGQAHSNIQPSLCVGFCIALTGYYPSRN
jgi:microcystin-dependent protein